MEHGKIDIHDSVDGRLTLIYCVNHAWRMEVTSCEESRMIFLCGTTGSGTTTWHRRQSTTQQSPQQHTGSAWE
jgi:hypothetical protein